MTATATWLVAHDRVIGEKTAHRIDPGRPDVVSACGQLLVDRPELRLVVEPDQADVVRCGLCAGGAR